MLIYKARNIAVKVKCNVKVKLRLLTSIFEPDRNLNIN